MESDHKNEDVDALKLVMEQLEVYQKTIEARVATMTKIVEDQAATMTRVADALDAHAKAMARLASAAEHYNEQQFHAVR